MPVDQRSKATSLFAEGASNVDGRLVDIHKRARARRALGVRRDRAAPTSPRGARRTKVRKLPRSRDFRASRARASSVAQTKHVVERSLRDGRFQTLSLRLAKAAHEMESQRNAPPAPPCDQYSLALTSIGSIVDAVAARIVDEHFGRVEAHRLHVEDCRSKDGGKMALEIGRCVGQEREAGRMRFGETVVGESFEHMEELLGRSALDAVGDHAFHEFGVHRLHALARTLMPHRAAKLIGFARRKSGRLDCQAHSLLLKERYAERALQHGLEFGWGYVTGSTPERRRRNGWII